MERQRACQSVLVGTSWRACVLGRIPSLCNLVIERSFTCLVSLGRRYSPCFRDERVKLREVEELS